MKNKAVGKIILTGVIIFLIGAVMARIHIHRGTEGLFYLFNIRWYDVLVMIVGANMVAYAALAKEE